MSFPKGHGDKYHGDYICARCGGIIATYHHMHTQWRGKQYNHGTHYHKWCWYMVRLARMVDAKYSRAIEEGSDVDTIEWVGLLLGDAPLEDK